jgi:hypothetical protein
LQWYFSMGVIDFINGIKYSMWVLLATWLELNNLVVKQHSEVLYDKYESREICEWARAYTLQINDPISNPTFKLHCVQKSQIQPSEDG